MSRKSYLLIVDDETELSDCLKDRFELEGFNVLTAASGNEAFEIYKQNDICAVISDVRMPNGDGIELLKNIRNESHDTPVINFITAFTDISTRDAYELGVDGIFSKPFDFQVILNSIKRLLMDRELRWSKTQLNNLPELTLKETYLSLEISLESHIIGIGRGGISLIVKGDIPFKEEEIAFELKFSGEPPQSIIGSGTLRWHDSVDSQTHVFGIEFMSLDDCSRALIIYWLEKNDPVAFIPSLKKIEPVE